MYNNNVKSLKFSSFHKTDFQELVLNVYLFLQLAALD